MYRTIDASFWTDPKVKRLPPDGKLLLLYLITNPHTHVSGIYVLNLKHAAIEIGWGINTLSKNLDTLSDAGFCHFDPHTDVLWVRKMMSYQGRGEKNLRSAAAHLAQDLHNSFLCMAFLDAYPAVKKFVKAGFIESLEYPIDRGSKFGTPDQEQDQEQEREGKPAPTTPTKHPHGEFKSVLLTEDEVGKLKERLGNHLQEYIKRLDLYSQSKPREFAKYKSHYATVLTWFDRDVKEGRVKTGIAASPRPTGVVL